MSNSIEGAEVFEQGTWNGLRFTEADLDGIADAFNALNLGGRVPLKFGHKGADARDDGQPALGWVQKVYRRGSKLVADFTDVPTVVYDAIKKGLYKFVSVELLRNVPAGNRKIPWVLDAIALLGATAPAVGTLGDLQKLTLSRRVAHVGGERVSFNRQETGNRMNEGQRYLEEGVRSGEWLPRVREAAIRQYGPDISLSDAVAFTRAARALDANGKRSAGGLQSRIPSGDGLTTTAPNERLLELARAEMKRAKADGETLNPDPSQALQDAVLVVMKRDPELGRAWVFEPDSFYEGLPAGRRT